MVTIENKTEAHIAFGVMGTRQVKATKPTVQDGIVVYETYMRDVPKVVESIVVPPTLAVGEIGSVEVDKAVYKKLKDEASFTRMVAEGKVRVVE